MTTNINLQAAIIQTRIASKLGKISGDTQNRIMRRLKHPAMLALQEDYKAELLAPMPPQWTGMMDLLESIHAEIAPTIERLRSAEANEFPKCLTLDDTATMKRVTPTLADYDDYTLTPEWWKEAELRERAEKKAVNARIKAEEKAAKIAARAAKRQMAMA